MALRVKSLLKEEGYTIPGARAVLKSEFRQKGPQLSLLGEAVPIPKSEAKQLRTLRRELEAIATMLAKPIGKAAGPPKASAHTAKAPAVHAMRSPRRTSAPSNRPAASEIPFD
jgi:hypothetical protein